MRTPRQNLERRQRYGGSQVTPGFDQHDLELGEFDEHALADQAAELGVEAERLGGVVLERSRWASPSR